ncbi:hypothetical protein PLESTM_000782900 [Pleodorina starrii]|nr:hypothetical protein PLESTM_000782900 [Pleodorina starrii]
MRVKPYSSTLATAAAAATTVERLTRDASAAASNAITFSHGAVGGEGLDRGGLTWALLGLELLWAAVSWLLLAAGCQIAHTESETLLCSGTTCAVAAAVQRSETTGQQGQQQAAVQRLSSWLLQRMGGDGVDGGWAGAGEGGGQEGPPRDPLQSGSAP